QYTVRILGGKRDMAQQALAEAGIGTMVYYPIPLHRLPVYGRLGKDFSEADKGAVEVLSLPMGPALGADAVDTVARALVVAIREEAPQMRME
ncbi:MAG: DegT/DnrJ/EryC1/StrS family aminotransferase, partial [Thermus sp.]|uniref:DegT/DnrJ/EryC1/StrS family aminotransferase n=1 Tax=Thermus sp. TaxID=275 RepID=UPI003918C3A4